MMKQSTFYELIKLYRERSWIYDAQRSISLIDNPIPSISKTRARLLKEWDYIDNAIADILREIKWDPEEGNA